MKTIKQTKRLEALLTKYRVQLRTTDSVVEHQTYRTKTTVPPLEFAVFEAAIKAVDAAWSAATIKNGAITIGSEEIAYDRKWNQHLAAINGFTLLDQFTPGSDAMMSYAQDFHYFCHLLKEAGLYFNLLD